MDINFNNWPPVYTVKENARAKYVRLKASLKGGLELTIPRRFNRNKIPAILEENRHWIEKQFIKIRSQLETSDQDILPTQIALLAIDQIWHIHYIQSDTKLKIISRPHQELVLVGDIKNKTLSKKLLAAWVKNHAQQYLLTQLSEVSKETKLIYKKATIRGQESRWGSCSTEKAINLNYKLLFLPPHLVTHVMIHELCHTVYLNHSVAFWRLVASFDPNWKEHNRELRSTNKWMPGWV